ncbi:hypothetical protein YC2023_033698 [Brassica napus]
MSVVQTDTSLKRSTLPKLVNIPKCNSNIYTTQAAAPQFKSDLHETACHPRRVIIQQCDIRLLLTKDDGPPTISHNIKAHKLNNAHPKPK